MRTWVWTLVLLGVAVALAVAARDHAGNVVVLAPPYRVEMSLAFAVASLVLLFVVLHVLLRLAGWTLAVGPRVRQWRRGRAVGREHDKLESGWVNLLQGHYVKAEQDFGTVAEHTGTASRKVLALLSAARAAHEMQEPARADAALQTARETARNQPALAMGVACASADLLLDQGRAQDALALLEPLQNGSARHVYVQRLLLRAYMATGRWDGALKLARGMRRHRAGDPGVAATLEAAAAHALRAAADREQRLAVWKGLKADERLLPEVALAAAGVFADDQPMVRKILQDALDHALDARVLTAYAQCDTAEVRPRLQRAETWLRKYPDHPELLRVLGSLCLHGQLWGPARQYLERSLQQRDDPRTHALLGSLYDRLDQPSEATRHWRLATAAVVGLTVLDRDTALPAADVGADPLHLDAGAGVYDADDEPPRLEHADEPPLADAEDDYALGAADLPPAEPSAVIEPRKAQSPDSATS